MEDCQRKMPLGEWMTRLYGVIDRQRLEITRLTAELATEHKVSSAMQQQVEAIQGDNAALREDGERLDLLEEWWEMSGKNTSGERIYTVRSHTTQATDASLRGAIDMIRAALDAKDSGKVGYIRQGSYTCNGSPRGCEGERFGGCDHCAALDAAKGE